ncbi:hypothetical protein Dimus_010981 [Dionaea muscipula]
MLVDGIEEDDPTRLNPTGSGGDRGGTETTTTASTTAGGGGQWRYATSFQRDLMAGAVMGGVVHTIVAPIERAKLLLQTQDSNLAIVAGRHRRFRGMFDCIFRTVREEGFLSLWRGNGSSVLRHYPSVALNFSLKVEVSAYLRFHCLELLKSKGNCGAAILNTERRKAYLVALLKLDTLLHCYWDLYRDILKNSDDGPPVMSSTAANFFAGGAAGCTTLIIVYPLDIAHTRLAADIGRDGTREFRGICHFISTICRKEGIRGIYQGLPASLHGMVVHRSIYFGGFDTLKEILTKEANLELALWKRWVVAQAVTTSASLVSYPLDTVRRRMMMQSGLEQPMYEGTLDCWRKIYRTEGLTSFYRGALSNMFRSTGAAAILVLYDELKKFMNLSSFKQM